MLTAVGIALGASLVAPFVLPRAPWVDDLYIGLGVLTLGTLIAVLAI